MVTVRKRKENLGFMDGSRADGWGECVKAHASSYMCPLWQQRPTLPRKLQGGFVWQTAVAYTSGLCLTVRVTSHLVPKLWRTVSASELMMNSLGGTPVGRTPPRFSTVLSAPGGQLLWRCVHWSINCSSQLVILGSSTSWQSAKVVPKTAAHGDQLEVF